MNEKYDKDYEIVFHLQEASVHLRELVEKIEKREIDPLNDSIPIEVELWHIQQHICLGWHLRDYFMNETRIDKETEDLINNAIPNWQASFCLIEPWKRLVEEKNQQRGK